MPIAWRNSRGSVTLVALSLAVVIGISLASYIALCQQSLQLSTRSLQLSRARQLAETGLEEALWSLNAAANPDPTVAATAWSNAGWSISGAAGADKSCTITGYDLGEGATGQVAITIVNFSGPTITPSVSTPIITAAATVTVPGLGVFTKTLTATTKPAPLFANALGIINPNINYPPALGNTYAVIFNTDGLVDSWDSDYLASAPAPNRDYIGTTTYPGSVPSSLFTSPPSAYTAASPSTYPDLSFNYAAVVAAPNIRLNNAEIRGYAATFGNPITLKTGPGGSKITAPPPPPGSPPVAPNVDPTRVGKSAFVPNFAVATPTGANSGTLDGSNQTIDNSSGTVPQIYDSSSANLILNGTTVTIKGRVIIRVPGNLSLINGGNFVIYKPSSPGPDQGQLAIFVGGDVMVDSNPLSGFQNDKNEPKNLALYSMNTGARTFLYGSPRDFCGVIYSASTTSKVEFQSSPNIYGAILANYNIEFDTGTNPQIHYDTALQYLPKTKNAAGTFTGWFMGVTTPFIIVQVTES